MKTYPKFLETSPKFLGLDLIDLSFVSLAIVLNQLMFEDLSLIITVITLIIFKGMRKFIDLRIYLKSLLSKNFKDETIVVEDQG